jgi:acetate---CoA ligase (ADP-forming)
VVAAGYEGRLFAVNRRGDPIDSIATYASVEALPESVDAAFVTVSADQCAATIRSLGAKGARVAVVAVGGFSETGGDTGRRLTEELRRAAQDTGVRVVGPVCNGLYNTSVRLALGYNAVHRRLLKPGKVALISHSGALAGPFINVLEAAGAGVSSFVSAGSEIDIGLADFIAYFSADAQTKVIAIIVDHVGDGRKFIAAVRSARRAGKHVVALKLGNTSLGRDATLAHSSHLAGKKQVYDAVFGAEGIRSTPSVETLALASALLSAGRSRKQGGVIGTSSSGGGAIILADLLTEQGVPVAKLDACTVDEIGSRLRFDAARIMNPFDLGLGGRRHYVANVATLARDPGAAVLVVFGTPVPQMQTAAQHAQLAMAAVNAAQQNPDLPVLYLSPAPLFDDERAILAAGAIPTCVSTLDAIAVAKALLPVASANDAHDELCADRRAGSALRGTLSEYQSKVLLRSHGMSFGEEALAPSLQAAIDAAQRTGYPVVLKASGYGIWHKSEQHLVELDIRTENDLRAAWRRLDDRLATLKNIVLDGFLVSPYIRDGVEAIVGFARDPEFGLMGIIGPGGRFAELYGADAMRYLTLPISQESLVIALEGSPLVTLARGYRGGEACDYAEFIRFVTDAGRVACELGEQLVELDLNPVKIRAHGKGVLALDALCVLREQ